MLLTVPIYSILQRHDSPTWKTLHWIPSVILKIYLNKLLCWNGLSWNSWACQASIRTRLVYWWLIGVWNQSRVMPLAHTHPCIYFYRSCLYLCILYVPMSLILKTIVYHMMFIVYKLLVKYAKKLIDAQKEYANKVH